MKKKKKTKGNIIAENRKARYNYELSDSFSAGIVLQGWEVKSLRGNKANIQDSYVVVKKGEIWLIGANIVPLTTISTQSAPEPSRSRKLMLKRKEINQLIGMTERKGFTIVPKLLYWKKNMVKIDIALAKGKQTHDKRAAIKEREWKTEQSRIIKKAQR